MYRSWVALEFAAKNIVSATGEGEHCRFIYLSKLPTLTIETFDKTEMKVMLKN